MPGVLSTQNSTARACGPLVPGQEAVPRSEGRSSRFRDFNAHDLDRCASDADTCAFPAERIGVYAVRAAVFQVGHAGLLARPYRGQFGSLLARHLSCGANRMRPWIDCDAGSLAAARDAQCPLTETNSCL
jgi:hypothetical protein